MSILVAMSGFNQQEAAALRHLLYPYEVAFVAELDDSDLIICRDHHPVFSKPTIRTPSIGESRSASQEPVCCDAGVVDLPFDLIYECAKRFRIVMYPKLSFEYRLSARIPFQYNIIPSSIRNRLLRMHTVDSSLSHHLANETYRKILIKAFSQLGLSLQRKKAPLFVITHDVDTEKGLRRASSFVRVEDELDVQSTWFLVSNEYPIGSDAAAGLAGFRIGSHDIKHDGRLIRIRRHEELVQRLKRSKEELERKFNRSVDCFRAPLLQFSGRIVAALSEAGYKFDFSVPCWEPVHPSTMSGFGIELVQPFEINGVTEVPLTLFQDHQVLNVLGMNTHEGVKFWLEQAKLVRACGGDIVLLVHPDYSYSQDLRAYRQLLTALLELHENSCVHQ